MTEIEIITDHYSELLDVQGTLYRYESTVFQKTRIDKFFPKLIEILSRTRFHALLELGCVTLDSEEIDSRSNYIQIGVYEIFVPDASPAEPIPQDISLNIVYEDDDLVVIDKPAGLVMHPAVGNHQGTMVNALLHHCGDSLSGIGGVMRPGIVHRLDKETSGLVVVAKNDITHRDLSEQFSKRTVERAYKALVWGRVSPTKGEIESQIGRHPKHRQRMASVKNGGRYALTHYKVLSYIEPLATMVECRLKTGRTHQIRVHLSEMGHSLIGDPVYGGDKPSARLSKRMSKEDKEGIVKVKRQCLHAYSLGFTHPTSKEVLFFESKSPKDFCEIVELVEKAGQAALNSVR